MSLACAHSHRFFALRLSLEVGDQRARLSIADTPVPVERLRIIEVVRLLHKAHAERAMIEIMCALNILADCGDVMNAVVQTHRRKNVGNRLRPRRSLDFLLVAIPRQHFRRRCAMSCSDRFRRFVPRPARTSGSELDNGSVRVADVKTGEIVSVERALDRNSQVYKSPLPAKKIVIVLHVKREVMSAANSRRSARSIRPLEKSHERSGLCQLVSKVEMVCSWRVEVDGALDEPQSKDSRVEVGGSLRRLADDRDVMDR